ncbi:hypothetical protein BDW75DRAFT_20190 [Aspergillus navahoensis]
MAYMSPDPLSANWSYDSAIDLFSLNTMIPETFPLDIPNDMLWDAKELPADFFAAPTDINGFTVSHDESLSSDQESDDQSFSPANFMASTPPSASALDLPSPMAMSMNVKTEPQTINTCTTQSQQCKRKASMISTSSSRYSSSPELPPQQQPSPPATTARKSRGASSTNNSDENAARGRNAAKRAAHNIIEKRYRTNMNAKFVALEKAMSVKTADVSKAVSSTNSNNGSGVKSSASLKKSEILSNAIAYMQELQEVNERLRKEISVLNRERRANAYC